MAVNIRKGCVVACSAMILAITGLPALADKPFEFSDSVTNPNLINPCSGETHAITFHLDFKYHRHTNNEVLTVARSGSTSDGYEMIAGRETRTLNARSGIFTARFMDMWRRGPGDMFQARGHIIVDFNTGDVKVNQLTFTCLGGPA